MARPKKNRAADEAIDSQLQRYRLPEKTFLPENSLPHAFAVVSNRVSHMMQKMYSERYGLTVTGWRLIAILGTHAPLSAKALADMTALDQVSISRALEHLGGKRLVLRRTDPADRRRALIRLSKRGEEVYNEIVPVLYAAERALIAALSDEEVAVMRRAMRILVERSVEVLPDDASWLDVLLGHGLATAAPGNGSAGVFHDAAEPGAEPPAGAVPDAGDIPGAQPG